MYLASTLHLIQPLGFSVLVYNTIFWELAPNQLTPYSLDALKLLLTTLIPKFHMIMSTKSSEVKIYS